jgi:hypothetical protein
MREPRAKIAAAFEEFVARAGASVEQQQQILSAVFDGQLHYQAIQREHDAALEERIESYSARHAPAQLGYSAWWRAVKGDVDARAREVLGDAQYRVYVHTFSAYVPAAVMSEAVQVARGP